MSGLLCCKCLGGDKKKLDVSADYLLPGGEWDPSLSTPDKSRSRSSNSSTSNARQHRQSNSSRISIRSLLTGGGWRGRLKREQSSKEEDGQSKGDYQPPPLIPSKTLPSIEEFKLLRTVGKGAFGKVCLLVYNKVGVLD